ncbi:MAG: hypothetical protein KJN97_14155 [Deltaproteobacteria bacterium]|nr:hypothetical protein [Deltaproteobacteria bacterium]
MVTKQHKLSERSDREKHLTPIYGRTAMDRPIPKYELPEEELAPEVAYNLVHDELMLDSPLSLSVLSSTQRASFTSSAVAPASANTPHESCTIWGGITNPNRAPNHSKSAG